MEHVLKERNPVTLTCVLETRKGLNNCCYRHSKQTGDIMHAPNVRALWQEQNSLRQLYCDAHQVSIDLMLGQALIHLFPSSECSVWHTADTR